MTAQTLKLAQLRFGHDPLAGKPLNSRRSGRGAGVEEMAAMLESQGQLSRLLVVLNPDKSAKADGLYFVFDGNLRLAAMQKYWKPDAPVLVEVADNADHALEKSIAANTSTPLHPVDRYRAYMDVIKADKIDAAQLARRFGATTRDMQRALALGALADDVLDAWLAGAITADGAQVFTLAVDKKDQSSILAKVIKGSKWDRDPQRIRHQILGKKKDVGNLVAFVGPEAYRHAGGKMTEDLFNSAHIAQDPALAVKLAKDKLADICSGLIKAGWSWALPGDDMPNGWAHSAAYGRIPAPKTPKFTEEESRARAILSDAVEAIDEDIDYDAKNDAEQKLEDFDSVVAVRGFKPADMQKSGVVVGINEWGGLSIEAGVLKPEEKKKAASATATKKKAKAKAQAIKNGEPEPTAGIPQSLVYDLSHALTRAAAKVVLHAPGVLVLRLLVAGLAADGNTIINLSHKGLGSRAMIDEADDPELLVRYREVQAFNVTELIAAAAVYVGASLDMATSDPDRSLVTIGKNDPESVEVSLILHELPPAELQAALKKEFDPDDFFTRAPAAIAKAALKDCGIEGIAVAGVAKKADWAKAAAAEARARGWLPVQLRTKDYAGPAGKPVTPAKAAAQTAKNKKRK